MLFRSAATTTGLLKASTGVIAAAVSGTDYAPATSGSANQLLASNGTGGFTNLTTGTGVVTALGVNTGSSGAFIVNGGALGTPLSGTVTNLTGTASININGTVGATTANTGAFTTLSASSTVSGTGFSTYLASPPAIGGTTPAAGTFTILTANGNTTLGDATTDTITLTGTVQPGVVISGSSSGDALRITQTGAGNALLFQRGRNLQKPKLVQDWTSEVNYVYALDTSQNVSTSSDTRGAATLWARREATVCAATVRAATERCSPVAARPLRDLAEDPAVGDRGLVGPGDVQLLRKVDGKLFGSLRLGDRAILVEDQLLKRCELCVGRRLEAVAARIPGEGARLFRGERRRGNEQDEAIPLGELLIQRH